MSQAGWASLAVVLTAVGGVLVGLLGWWQNHVKDPAAIEAVAKDVATRASEAAIEALRTALTYAQAEIAELRLEVAEMPKLRREIAVLCRKVERCDEEKENLGRRVKDLEKNQ